MLLWFQASQLLGSAMTYTLFEYVKENADELTADQQEVTQVGMVELCDRGFGSIEC